MTKREIGKTGKHASIIGLGCEHLDRKPYEQLKTTIDTAIDCGINIFDIFMPGREVRENIAKALGNRRKDILIQGHICSTDLKQQYDISRDLPTVKKFFEEHLRLCNGYIDFGMLFFIDSDEDYKNVFETGIADYALKLKQNGEIGHIGFSSHNPLTAIKAINTGLPELLMFSLNPAFDMIPADEDVFNQLENGFKPENFDGIDPKRAELYKLCEQKNVGITVMKSLGAGKLISAEHTPFSKPLTVAQCVHYALSRPAVSSVLLGCQSSEQVLDSVKYLDLSDEERDYSEILSSATKSMKGVCVYCNHCQPCPVGIDIAAVNKYLDIALLDTANIPPSIKSHYRSLENNAGKCIACGHCEKRCPFGVAVAEKMKEAQRLLTRAENRPFPQHAGSNGEYAVKPLMPSDKTQEQLDSMIIAFFKKILLNDLIIDQNSPADKDGFRLILRHFQSWGIEEEGLDVSHLTVSESHGYGMIMLALMAGSEEKLALTSEQWIYNCKSLKDYFDAMLRTVQFFPCTATFKGENKLFTWELMGNPSSPENKSGYTEKDGMKIAPFKRRREDLGGCATDGDMDIIYALLLADKQWGSEGRYNYKQIALDMLGSLWRYCVHEEYFTLLVGDWAKERQGRLTSATRSSDFILSHLKAYAEADPEHDWLKVAEATYNVIKDIRSSENAAGRETGFLPDFVIRGEGKWVVPEGFVMERNDHTYAHNSCRVPWRQGTDYLLYGNSKIGGSSLWDYIIAPLNSFAKSLGSPESFGPFNMDGTPSRDPDPHLFAPPFLVTAVCCNDQAWVNKLWDWAGLDEYKEHNYADYIKMLVMLTASGNYWKP